MRQEAPRGKDGQKEVLGWRARFGLIVPSNNTVIEPEFYRAVPEGVTVHTTRVLRKRSMMDMPRQAVQTADRLWSVDAIGYACLTTSFYKGLGWDEELGKRIKEVAKKPTTTAASAMVKGLKEMGVERVCVASPFKKDVNEKLESFLEGNGFEVTSLKALEPAPTPGQVTKLPSSVSYELATKAFKPGADGVFICATDFKAMDVLEALERGLGKPAVSTNQALMWDLLGMLKVNRPIKGYGQLLERL